MLFLGEIMVAINGNYSTKSNLVDFPKDFRQQILALLLKSRFTLRYGSIIKPEFFVLDLEQRIATVIHDHRDQYRGKLPTYADMALELGRTIEWDDTIEDYVKDLYHLSGNGLHKTEAEILSWARANAVRKAFAESLDDYEEGHLDPISDRFREALKVGRDIIDIGQELLAGNWFSTEFGELVPTPWATINNITGGGLGAGELGVMIAPTGQYKSTALVDIGARAAGIVSRKNVIHFSMEMSESKVLARYAHRVCFQDSRGVDKQTYMKNLHKAAKLRLKGRIRVKQYPSGQAKVRDLHDFCRRMQDDGLDLGMVIIDYPALLQSERHYKQKRFELEEIHVGVRAMAIELGVPMWIAAQSNRASFKKQIITKEDIGEAISIAQVMDVGISINQNPDEKKVDALRLYTAKVRDGADGHIIPCTMKYPAIISGDAGGDNAGDSDE